MDFGAVAPDDPGPEVELQPVGLDQGVLGLGAGAPSRNLDGFDDGLYVPFTGRDLPSAEPVTLTKLKLRRLPLRRRSVRRLNRLKIHSVGEDLPDWGKVYPFSDTRFM